MSKLYLILAFHNHQPVGNFDHVLEDSYNKSYLPFLEALLRHPNLKVVLHYSGNLLSWIGKRHPEAIDIIRNLVSNGRVELLSGGFYEPVIPVLPEEDRQLQIEEFSLYIKKNFGYTPKGMWLAERVWEPQMPKCISKAGIEYLPVDDYHFKMTGLEEGDLLGYYITEDEGYKISVFPGSEKLRYYIPFRTVEDTISYFREIHMRGGNPLLTFADDGEKFGVWPNTYKHCYEDGWLDNFLAALEDNSDWIETTTFSEYSSKFQSLGRVYLPTASYREMGEWALPSEVSLEYEYVLEELGKLVGEKSKHLLRGGIWRSFMVKYPESNHLHKRMFMISQKVQEACVINSQKGREAQINVWKGQCNDAYWHGVFGGLYLPHLRSALYRHLINAEALANEILKEKTEIKRFDFDCDGFDDIIINTKNIALTVSEKGGSLTELSLYRQSVNIFDILSRRPEAYHSKLTKVNNQDPDATKTIHDQLSVKEEGLANYLIYDEYRRSSLLDRFLPVETGLEDVRASKYEELGDFIDGVYSMDYSREGENIILSLSREGVVQGNSFKLEKSLEIGPSGIRADYLLEGAFSGLFAMEMNISLLGSPYATITTGDLTSQIRSMATHEKIREFSIEDKFLNLILDFRFDEAVDMWHYPVETISLSEQGVERLYQGTAFLFVTNLNLPAPETQEGMNSKKKLGFSLNFEENNR